MATSQTTVEGKELFTKVVRDTHTHTHTHAPLMSHSIHQDVERGCQVPCADDEGVITFWKEWVNA